MKESQAKIIDEKDFPVIRKEMAEKFGKSEEEIAEIINELTSKSKIFSKKIILILFKEIDNSENQQIQAQAIFSSLLREAVSMGKVLAITNEIPLKHQQELMIDFINKSFKESTKKDLKLQEEYNKMLKKKNEILKHNSI